MSYLPILKNVDNLKSYYAGGTLCIDVSEGEVLLFGMPNEAVYSTKDNRLHLLTIEELKEVFDIYRRVKGETEYFFDAIQKSIMKYFN